MSLNVKGTRTHICKVPQKSAMDIMTCIVIATPPTSALAQERPPPAQRRVDLLLIEKLCILPVLHGPHYLLFQRCHTSCRRSRTPAGRGFPSVLVHVWHHSLSCVNRRAFPRSTRTK